VLRFLGALIGDVLAVVLFVAIGLLQHGFDISTQNLVLVGWPFAAALIVGHLASQSWRAPFRVWPQGVFVWAITIVGAMAVRTLMQAGTEVSFVIVTAIVLGILMLGWRALASYLTRGSRKTVVDAADLAGGEQPEAADAQPGSDPSRAAGSSPERP
jgi:membrane protein implicated in regulation of membrane protease activity